MHPHPLRMVWPLYVPFLDSTDIRQITQIHSHGIYGPVQCDNEEGKCCTRSLCIPFMDNVKISNHTT